MEAGAHLAVHTSYCQVSNLGQYRHLGGGQSLQLGG